jgi:DNA-directed RNA polymerase subunit M/transcription elongation factor TFIIS
MSDGWKDGYWERFKCPLCGSTKYVEVRVKRPSGRWYTTPFYKCFECTVMFDDPVSFSQSRVKAIA